MFCSRCGTSLADGSQFCVDCGHTVEGSFPAAPAPSGESVCGKCAKSIFPGSRFCSNCGNPIPTPTATAADAGAAAAAAMPAYDPSYWQQRQTWSIGRITVWLVLLFVLGFAGWVVSTSNSIAPRIKEYLITAHMETITEGTVAIKPRGFATYRVTVPEGAIDVAVLGQFEVSARAQNDIEVLLLTEAELVTWQSGYAISPFYDSGRVTHANLESPLPSRSGTYYLVLSNKPSTVEKTVHLTAGLHYDTWLPDSVSNVKQKVLGWFE